MYRKVIFNPQNIDLQKVKTDLDQKREVVARSVFKAQVDINQTTISFFAYYVLQMLSRSILLK